MPDITEDNVIGASEEEKPETPKEEASSGASPKTPKKTSSKPKKKKKAVTKMTTPEGTTTSCIKLKDIILPDDWNREKLVNIPNLAHSIKEVGLVNALSVMPADTPGKYILVDGRRRFAALQEAKISEANVNILPAADPTDAYLISLVANENRESNNSYELALAFEKLVSAGKKNREIAKACGKTEGYVSQHRAILRTPDFVQKAIRDGHLPPSATRVLVKLNYEEDQAFYDKVADALIEGTISLEDATEKIDFYVEKKKEKAAKADGGTAKKKKSGAKTKAEKKRGPTIKIPDYSEKEILKQMTPRNKSEGQEYLVYFADRLSKTSSKVKSAYNQGVLHGLEIAYNLRGE